MKKKNCKKEQLEEEQEKKKKCWMKKKSMKGKVGSSKKMGLGAPLHKFETKWR